MKAIIVTPDQRRSRRALTNFISTSTDPVVLQRLESAAILGTALTFYSNSHASWWLFCALLLIPDVSILAYLHSKKVGAVVYNIFHSYLAPLSLGLLMFQFSMPFITEIVLIWISHIAFDRCMGYGLKYPTNFKHTHLAWK